MLPPFTLEHTIDKTVREEWGRILSSLTKSVGDIQLAEDCLQDAIVSAMEHWQKNGLPKTPAAWLIIVARRKAIDKLRSLKMHNSKQSEISYLIDLENEAALEPETHEIPDKRLEMIFTCCHPSLEEKTRVALTLRTLGGLSTEEIAGAFLDTPDSMQRRLARAKNKISAAGIPYKIPESSDLPERISTVLRVLYLIFNEGYSASNGEQLTRTDLSDESIRLVRIISGLMPDETEVAGLLALMLLHDSRCLSRTDTQGRMIALEHQNRSRWNKAKISEGVSILKDALPKKQIGPYQLQAAISAVHAQAATWNETDWQEIVELYALLYRIEPSPIVLINWAVSVSYARTLAEALVMLDEAAQEKKLDRYQPYFTAKADLLFRAGKTSEARDCINVAIDMTENKQEKAFLTAKALTY